MVESLLEDKPAELKWEDYVGEGKQFPDQITLLKSKLDTNQYAKVLEARIDDIREDYLKLRENAVTEAKLADMLRQVEDRKALASSQQEPILTKQEPSAKPEDVRNLVSEEVLRLRRQDQEQANFETVRSKLKEQFGDNYPQAVRNRISELGLSENDFNDMARKSPNAVINALGLNSQVRETFQAPPQSSGSFRPQGATKRTWSYYQDLKKSNPRLYLDPKIATQMHNDALALGNSFYDGDFGEYASVS